MRTRLPNWKGESNVSDGTGLEALCSEPEELQIWLNVAYHCIWHAPAVSTVSAGKPEAFFTPDQKNWKRHDSAVLWGAQFPMNWTRHFTCFDIGRPRSRLNDSICRGRDVHHDILRRGMAQDGSNQAASSPPDRLLEFFFQGPQHHRSANRSLP